MFDKKIHKAKKGIKIDIVFFVLGLFLLLGSIVEGWIPEAITILFATRIIYGLTVVHRLKRERNLASI